MPRFPPPSPQRRGVPGVPAASPPPSPPPAHAAVLSVHSSPPQVLRQGGHAQHAAAQGLCRQLHEARVPPDRPQEPRLRHARAAAAARLPGGRRQAVQRPGVAPRQGRDAHAAPAARRRLAQGACGPGHPLSRPFRCDRPRHARLRPSSHPRLCAKPRPPTSPQPVAEASPGAEGPSEAGPSERPAEEVEHRPSLPPAPLCVGRPTARHFRIEPALAPRPPLAPLPRAPAPSLTPPRAPTATTAREPRGRALYGERARRRVRGRGGGGGHERAWALAHREQAGGRLADARAAQRRGRRSPCRWSAPSGPLPGARAPSACVDRLNGSGRSRARRDRRLSRSEAGGGLGSSPQLAPKVALLPRGPCRRREAAAARRLGLRAAS